MNDYIRREPILQIRSLIDPNAHDEGIERQWRLSVAINEAWERLRYFWQTGEWK